MSNFQEPPPSNDSVANEQLPTDEHDNGFDLAHDTPTSPKVSAATLSGSLGLVVSYLVGQIPWVNSWPAPVQAAVQVLVVAALIYAGGYLRGDLLRQIGQKVLADELERGIKVQNGE